MLFLYKVRFPYRTKGCKVICTATAMIADLVIAIHFLWIIFIIAGFPLFLCLNAGRWRVIHALSLAAMVVMQLTGAACPLTYLEAYLKRRAGYGGILDESFIMRHLEDVIYVNENTFRMVAILTFLYLLAVALSFRLRPLKGRKR